MFVLKVINYLVNKVFIISDFIISNQRRENSNDLIIEMQQNRCDVLLNLERPAQKSVLIAYILWLFGGIFGLHHIYLHRDRQAFVWWSTGGFFGFGWFSEILQIPSYVRDANEDSEYIKELINKIRLKRKPPFSLERFHHSFILGTVWAHAVMLGIPEGDLLGFSWDFLHWVIPLSVGLGVWTVGNIDREQGVLWQCVLASYTIYPIRYWIYNETFWISIMSFFASLVFVIFSKQWQTRPSKREKPMKRIMILSAAICIYLSLCGCNLLFNIKTTDNKDNEIPMHEEIYNFFKSSWWTDFKQAYESVRLQVQYYGWKETWRQINEHMNFDVEINAYKVLGGRAIASQSKIKTQWRKLSLKFHPDKVKGDTLKSAAQEKFMEIQEAYELLSNLKRKRQQKNNKIISDL